MTRFELNWTDVSDTEHRRRHCLLFIVEDVVERAQEPAQSPFDCVTRAFPEIHETRPSRSS